MRCAKCGAEVKPTDQCCSNCAPAGKETHTAQDIPPEHDTYERTGEGSGSDESGHHFQMKRINLTSGGFWLTMLGMCILLMIIIFALPFVLLAVLIFILCRSFSRWR